jgi:hypothetical protein
MDAHELKTWEEERRHPHVTRSTEAWMNHRWNPENHPGNKTGRVILEARVDPKTQKRMIVLDVPRRQRHVTVWVSYPELIRLFKRGGPHHRRAPRHHLHRTWRVRQPQILNLPPRQAGRRQRERDRRSTRGFVMRYESGRSATGPRRRSRSIYSGRDHEFSIHQSLRLEFLPSRLGPQTGRRTLSTDREGWVAQARGTSLGAASRLPDVSLTVASCAPAQALRDSAGRVLPSLRSWSTAPDDLYAKRRRRRVQDEPTCQQVLPMLMMAP